MQPTPGSLDWALAAKQLIETSFIKPKSPLTLLERALVEAPAHSLVAGLYAIPLRALPTVLDTNAAELGGPAGITPFTSGVGANVLLRLTELGRRRIRAQGDDAPATPSHLTAGYAQQPDGSFRLELRMQRPTIGATLRALTLARKHGVVPGSIGTLHTVTAQGTPHPSSLNNDPLALGSSVGTGDGQPGTLGSFVCTKDGPAAFLSCAHILARGGSGTVGDAVFHPAVGDAPQRIPVGRLEHFNDLRPAGPKPWDAATALVDPARHCGRNRIPLGRGFAHEGSPLAQTLRGPLPPFAAVAKIGRRSGQTFGRVIAENLAVEILYDVLGRDVEIEGLIEIEWETLATPFSEPGDSGSLVYLRDGLAPVGLIVGGGTIEFQDGTVAGRSYACPLAPILDAWELCLL